MLVVRLFLKFRIVIGLLGLYVFFRVCFSRDGLDSLFLRMIVLLRRKIDVFFRYFLLDLVWIEVRF